MKQFTTRFIAAALLATAAAQAADEANPLKIYTAIEVEFGTDAGKVYHLQGSGDFSTWTDIGVPVFGVGRPVNQVFSTRGGGNVAFEFYRLQIAAAPTGDLAPWTLTGLTLNFDDTSGGDLMQFLTDTNGVDLGINPDPFNYQITRPGPNVVVAELNYGALYYGVPSSNKIDVLTLTFTAPGMGTWSRDEFRNGSLKDHDVGVFSVVVGATPGNPNGTPPVVPTAIPTALTGLSYLFQSGETPDRLDFSTAVTGLETGDDVEDDEPNAFTYTYALTGADTASLVVTFKAGKYDEYDLTFANGAQGTFVRREFKDGVLDDTDQGAFSAGGSLPGGGGGNQGNPPTDPVVTGFTYTMQSGDIPEQVAFQTATTGVQLDDSAPSSFIYTHAFTAPGVARLVVRFDTDKWDEYDLTYTGANAGTFVRREFRNSVLNDTDTGSFTRTHE